MGKLTKFLKKVERQVSTNVSHLTNNAKTVIVKQQLHDERQKAREEIQKFKEDPALNVAIAPNGGFDKTIQELEMEISAAKKRYQTVLLSINSEVNAETDVIKALACAKACITAVETTLSNLKITRASILASMTLANQEYAILQEVPKHDGTSNNKIAEGKTAADKVIVEARKVMTEFAKVDLTVTRDTAKTLLNNALPVRLKEVTEVVKKLQFQKDDIKSDVKVAECTA